MPPVRFLRRIGLTRAFKWKPEAQINHHHPMTLTTILLIILLLVLIGGIPTKGYGVGHGLNGGVGLLLVILLVLYLMGKI